MIISEGTQISQQGQGYPGTPGMYTAEQIEGWKIVTSAVHKAGGLIFAQLWHAGRISHPSHQPNGALHVAPSAIAAQNSGTYTVEWQPTEILTPRALETDEVAAIVQDFKTAAQNAKEAGFDGVQIHGANGYLIDQFLQDGSNKRNDIYGGSIENRMRFLLEIVDAVSSVWGAARVAVRLSPFGTFNDMQDSDPIALFTAVLQQLDARKISFVDLIEPRSSAAGSKDGHLENTPNTADIFRKAFKGVLISAGGYDGALAKEAMATGAADAVSFGRWFIANPDLPFRIQHDLPFNPYDRSTFYGGDEKGYTDYPTAQAKAA